MNDTYSVRVTREGRWWMIAVHELDELTQSRRIGDAQRMAREVIALRTGQPLDDVSVDMTIEVAGTDVSTQVQRARHEREEAERQEPRAAASYRALAKELSAEDVPVRDIGDMLGVSYQRAHQLVVS